MWWLRRRWLRWLGAFQADKGYALAEARRGCPACQVDDRLELAGPKRVGQVVPAHAPAPDHAPEGVVFGTVEKQTPGNATDTVDGDVSGWVDSGVSGRVTRARLGPRPDPAGGDAGHPAQSGLV